MLSLASFPLRFALRLTCDFSLRSASTYSRKKIGKGAILKVYKKFWFGGRGAGFTLAPPLLKNTGLGKMESGSGKIVRVFPDCQDRKSGGGSQR